MKCNKCGYENPENEKICQQCGAVLEENNERDKRIFTFFGFNMIGQNGEKPMPMKWYIFLVLISLPFSAFSNIITGIQSIAYPSISAGEMAGLGELSKVAVERFNIFSGICMILVGIFMFYTRRVLIKFRRSALLYVNSVYAATGLVNCVTSGLLGYIIGAQAKDTAALMIGASIISTVFMLIVNTIYFKKRQHLFVN